MEQLLFSGTFAPRRLPTDRAVCFQRTSRGLFVGTLSQSDYGFSGHVLAPKHPMLPNHAGTGSLGHLHDDRHTAFNMLAMAVAKQSWDGQLGFEASCLEALDDSVKAEFDNWLTDGLCQLQAPVLAGTSDATRCKEVAATLRPGLIAERARLLIEANVARINGSRTLQ